MQTFRNYDQLEQFGIRTLTGEACGLAMRVLCDVTEEGRQLLRAFFRMEVNADKWNGGVGSVMLPRSVMEDIWIFANVRAGKPMVFAGGHVHHDEWETRSYETCEGETVTYKTPKTGWRSEAFVCESEKDIEHVNNMVASEFFYISRTYSKSNQPGNGLDNRHAMSGRTE